MIAPNTVIGARYRVVKPLGGGGMKLVYLAEDLRLASRPCALAEMVDSFTSPEMQRQAVAAFQREADMLAQLANEHIPRVFDRFSEENHHYLVMEYIDGITLEERLRQADGKLAEQEMVEIALQVLDTLEYLHTRQPPVVYRDLKPSNVMLTRGGLAKLIDFGIARFFQGQQNATMIGTQGYAPPEQYRGRVDARSDLYALGATMHHALSGRDPAAEPPFSFPPLRSVAAAVTPALAELIDQSLQYDAVLRVRDATEFKQRLLAIKLGAGVNSAAPAPAARSGQPQLRLPLGRPAVPSAPTVVSAASEIACEQCGRRIPSDSRFCSFCAAPVRVVLGPAHVAPDARTADLTPPAGAALYGPESGARARVQRDPNSYFVLAALLAAALIITVVVSYAIMRRNQVAAGSSVPGESYAPAAPGAPAMPPYVNQRMLALRQALDAAGYTNVHFKLVGDTLILTGTVPTETDRMIVQSMVFTVAGVFSMEDHLRVQEGFAGP
jgi:predicted Ser/Thr protein kinase